MRKVAAGCVIDVLDTEVQLTFCEIQIPDGSYIPTIPDVDL